VAGGYNATRTGNEGKAQKKPFQWRGGIEILQTLQNADFKTI